MGKEVALRRAVCSASRATRTRGLDDRVRGLLRLEALAVGPRGPAKLDGNLAAVRAKKGPGYGQGQQNVAAEGCSSGRGL